MISTGRVRSRAAIGTLLGTVSFLAMSGTGLAQPATAEQAPPELPSDVRETVLVTGSLIHGAEVVGVPVQSLGQVEIRETGSLLVSDLLRNIPGIQVQTSTNFNAAIGNSGRATPVNIHNLNGGSTRTLMLINGMRYPVQSQDTAFYDPSIIPTLAVERVDVLLDGASATYGSDAVAGVINVILRRGFDGAITQVRISQAPDADGLGWQASQVWGKTWEGGGITLTAEHYKTAEIKAKHRDFYTYDFTPWGLDDTSLLRSSSPGVVSTGAPSAVAGTGCNNCYSVPRGQNGVDLIWTTLLANKGVANEINGYLDSSLTPPQTRTAYVGTFDQQLFPGVSLFVDAFYSNRRVVSQMNTTASVGQTTSFTVAVPTTNSFYPAGAPAGLRVSYNLGVELPPYTSAVSRGQRVATGFNLDLPWDWKGKLSFQMSDNLELANSENLTNPNNVSAALGNTVTGSGGVANYTKPADIPYLNLFCDPTAYACNDPATLDFIRGYRRDRAHWITREWNVNFDGPLFSLPAGEVLAAVGGGYVKDSFAYSRILTNTTVSAQNPGFQIENPNRNVTVGYVQLNVPVFSDANALPLFRSLTVEAGFRVDRYSDFGYTRNPKVAVNWMPTDDLNLRGSWGTSFRAPAFSDNYHGVIRRVNAPTGANNSVPACTAPGGTPTPGSAAAILNPTCSAALQYQGGVSIGNATGFLVSSGIRPVDYALGPEKAASISTGFDYTPVNFLKGLQITGTYFFVKIRDAINGASADLNEPNDRANITLYTDPGFQAKLAAALADPVSEIPPGIPVSDIKFILDTAPTNVGSITTNGLDFGVRYDWDFGDWGVWKAGVDGTYFLNRKLVDSRGGVTDSFVGASPNAGLGNSTESRLLARGQLGWVAGPWSVTAFVNYQGHYFLGAPRPPSPPATANYTSLIPAQYTFDLSLGYDTGEAPAIEYLRNIGVQLVVKNLIDRKPPFAYNISTTAGNTAYPPSFSPVGREVSLTLTKTW